ncbi:MAG: radical SAM/SPASM domain-containing protein [Calditrichia bacterium]
MKKGEETSFNKDREALADNSASADLPAREKSSEADRRAGNFSTREWLNYLENSVLPPHPPANPRSPFIPRNIHEAANILKIAAGLGFSLLRRKPAVWGTPVLAHIEPTSLCNLKCPLCPTGSGNITRRQTRLNYENFKTIIDKFPGTVKMLLLWNQGEPFMVKDLSRMIRYAKQRGMYVVTSTNGHFFRSDRIAGEVVASGIDEIIISLDGADQTVYEKYRVGGKLEWVFDGIQWLVRAKKAQNKRSPLVHLQFILMQQNLHQRKDMIELGRKLGADRLSFKTVQITDYAEGENYLPDDPAITRYVEKTGDGKHITRKRRFFADECLRLWFSLVVNCDGRVSPCCFDKDGDYALGNLIDDSFESVWFGRKYRDFRQHLLKSRYDLKMCNDCTEGLKGLFLETINYHREK